MDVDALLEKIKKKLTPSEHSELPNQFLAKLNTVLPEDVCASIGGSWAKNTYLPGNHDIDVFVRFPKNYSDKDMVEVLADVLKEYDPLRVKGSRDYFQLHHEGFDFEIVPVLKVSSIEEARNVTDMSPLHVDYVNAHVAKKPGLNNEIRLMKQFCKANGVYGAESYLNGVSGHVIDLLVIYHGGFIPLLEAVKTWSLGKQVFIDLTKKHKDASFLNEAKREGPLVLIDPVQKDRNAAAALGKEKFSLLIEAAKKFLQEAKEEYFLIKKMTPEQIRQRHPKALVYELWGQSGSKDISGTKCYKAHHHFISQATRKGFEIIAEGFSYDGAIALCFVEASNEPLSETYIHQGPPVMVKDDAKKFREKYPQAKEKNGNLFVELRREERTLRELLQVIVESDYFSSRTTGTKLL